MSPLASAVFLVAAAAASRCASALGNGHQANAMRDLMASPSAGSFFMVQSNDSFCLVDFFGPEGGYTSESSCTDVPSGLQEGLFALQASSPSKQGEQTEAGSPDGQVGTSDFKIEFTDSETCHMAAQSLFFAGFTKLFINNSCGTDPGGTRVPHLQSFRVFLKEVRVDWQKLRFWPVWGRENESYAVLTSTETPPGTAQELKWSAYMVLEQLAGETSGFNVLDVFDK